MKKILFLLTMLAGVAASATVTVTPLGVDYDTKKVTFSVAWDSAAYNNRVWVWIDLCPIAGTQPSGNFTPAVVASPTKISGNGTIANPTTRGFFITYAGTNSGTTVTATLSNAPADKFNWCAYGSDAPPKAETLSGGGYKLYGTPPFTINGNLNEENKTFGAGTCITSITDLTGNPDGIAAQPSLSSPNSPSRCSAGAVTLSVTVGGGTTTAMTYTWNIGGTPYTNQTNSYTTGSLSASTTYSVKVKNANNCESNTANSTISVIYPGNAGQAATSCGCASGTTQCGSTCVSGGNYTTCDGGCTGSCNTAYTQLRNVCGSVLNQQYGTCTNNACTTGCVTSPVYDTSCTTYYTAGGHNNPTQENCPTWCYNQVYGKRARYSYYWSASNPDNLICFCWGCN